MSKTELIIIPLKPSSLPFIGIICEFHRQAETPLFFFVLLSIYNNKNVSLFPHKYAMNPNCGEGFQCVTSVLPFSQGLTFNFPTTSQDSSGSLSNSLDTHGLLITYMENTISQYKAYLFTFTFYLFY